MEIFTKALIEWEKAHCRQLTAEKALLLEALMASTGYKPEVMGTLSRSIRGQPFEKRHFINERLTAVLGIYPRDKTNPSFIMIATQKYLFILREIKAGANIRIQIEQYHNQEQCTTNYIINNWRILLTNICGLPFYVDVSRYHNNSELLIPLDEGDDRGNVGANYHQLHEAMDYINNILISATPDTSNFSHT